MIPTPNLRNYFLTILLIAGCLAVAGPLGTLVGIVQAFAALETLDPGQRTGMMIRAVGIAATPTAFSGLVLAIAAVPVGFVVSRVERGGR